MATAKPTKNDLIVQAAWDALAGKFSIEREPMYCLKVVRQIVEHALGIHFYKRYRTEKVEENRTKEPWARDIQRSLRKQGLQIPFDERKAGDLVFVWQLAFPYGHCGILMADGDWILENTPSERGYEKGNIKLTHLSEFKHSFEIFRL